MPRRNSNRQIHKSLPPKIPKIDNETVIDPFTNEEATLTQILRSSAKKQYICPGCNQEIMVKTTHFVVVPKRYPADRRHWHSACIKKALKR